jgi:hypothetical protein
VEVARRHASGGTRQGYRGKPASTIGKRGREIKGAFTSASVKVPDLRSRSP